MGNFGSFGHRIDLISEVNRRIRDEWEERHRGDPLGGQPYQLGPFSACGQARANCGTPATYRAAFDYVAGRSGRVTSRVSFLCPEHARRFADKHGLELPTEEAGS